jgi:UDP-N-acetyl-D-mannosaminuronate dehydrogenase
MGEAIKKQNVVVLGLGEVGKPLFDLASRYHNVVGVDIAPSAEPIEAVDVMHVCYPFQIRDFIGTTARYIERFQPRVTVINSTVSIGTTRAVSARSGTDVVNSPVRGKHARMFDELLSYVKFVGAANSTAGILVTEHFESMGLKTKLLSSPEATELAKLTETTYFGLIIAWAQEVERYCDQSGQDYNEITSFWEEIKYLPPVKFFPGVIGGHCVMPNIEILSRFEDAALLKAIQASNAMKQEREAQPKEVAALA